HQHLGRGIAVALQLRAAQIGDAHHVRRHEPLAHALWRHEQAIRSEPDADVAVVRRRVAARVHPTADLDDVGAQLRLGGGSERSRGGHAVLARYSSRQAVEQKYTVSRPTAMEIARSGTTNVPHTGSRAICTPRCGTVVRRRAPPWRPSLNASTRRLIERTASVSSSDSSRKRSI